MITIDRKAHFNYFFTSNFAGILGIKFHLHVKPLDHDRGLIPVVERRKVDPKPARFVAIGPFFYSTALLPIGSDP